jgi:protocatechuate 3,4-dioxygenase beta subunit
MPNPPGSPELLLLVADATTGKPVPQATIHYLLVEDLDDFVLNRPELKSDSNGAAVIRYPTAAPRLMASALAPGYAPRRILFEPEFGERIPTTYTLNLIPNDRPVGGTLLDPDGTPVPDAEIRVFFMSLASHSNIEMAREAVGTAQLRGTTIARSDSQGRWSTTAIPPAHPGFMLTASHPGFAAARIIDAAPGRAPAAGSPAHDPLTRLWAGSLTTTLQPGFRVNGVVRDRHGQPVPGAALVHQPLTDNERRTTADARGEFTWDHVLPGRFAFTASSPGHAPMFTMVQATPGMPPVEVTLGTPHPLHVRTVDPQGAAIEGVHVIPLGRDGAPVLGSGKTNPEGRLTWPDAPAGETLQLTLLKPGWTETRDVPVTIDPSEGEREHVLTLTPAPVLEGRVIDSVSRLPIAEFRAIAGNASGWLRGSTHHGYDGVLRLPFPNPDARGRLRIEAPGYEAFVLETLPATHEPLEIAMARAEPDRGFHGIVLQPDGRPAGGVEVALLDLGHTHPPIRLGHRALGRGNMDFLVETTTADGRFRFTPESSGRALIAIGDGGLAVEAADRSNPAREIRLKPWGRIEGRIAPNLRNSDGCEVWIQPMPDKTGLHLMLSSPNSRPDASGAFSFDSLPPGTYLVSLRTPNHGPEHHRRMVTVEPGGCAQVTLADPGPRVRGRLAIQPAPAPHTTQGSLWVSLASHTLPPPFRFPAFATPPAPDELNRLRQEAGRVNALRSAVIVAEVASDGSFTSLEGLPPGDYRLGVHVLDLEQPALRKLSDKLPPELQEANRRTFARHRAAHGTPVVEVPFTLPQPHDSNPSPDVHDLGDIDVRLGPGGG